MTGTNSDDLSSEYDADTEDEGKQRSPSPKKRKKITINHDDLQRVCDYDFSSDFWFCTNNACTLTYLYTYPLVPLIVFRKKMKWNYMLDLFKVNHGAQHKVIHMNVNIFVISISLHCQKIAFVNDPLWCRGLLDTYCETSNRQYTLR
jgi:hypothetical protein